MILQILYALANGGVGVVSHVAHGVIAVIKVVQVQFLVGFFRVDCGCIISEVWIVPSIGRFELVHNSDYSIKDYTTGVTYMYSCEICKDKFFKRNTSAEVKSYKETGNKTETVAFSVCVKELKYMREYCGVHDSTLERNLNIGEGGCQ